VIFVLEESRSLTVEFEEGAWSLSTKVLWIFLSLCSKGGKIPESPKSQRNLRRECESLDWPCIDLGHWIDPKTGGGALWRRSNINHRICTKVSVICRSHSSFEIQHSRRNVLNSQAQEKMLTTSHWGHMSVDY
jgi:hypothetical protein